jgi:hypothetical protein
MAEITHSSPSSGAGERASPSPDPPERQARLEEEEETPEEQEPEPEDSPSAPPLPDEEPPPPLPNEAPPGQEEDGGGDDDGWEPVWDAGAQTFYFYNRFSGAAQWENPRVPDAAVPVPGPGPGPDTGKEAEPESEHASPPVAGGYNPAIHGDYDPTAPYAQRYEQNDDGTGVGTGAGSGGDGSGAYVAAGAFNRFTGKWQAMSVTPENYNDENKSRRQMNAFFDVDAAANSHDGRSLRAERSAKKLSRKEVKMFREKRREKKEEKRRAWLRD